MRRFLVLARSATLEALAEPLSAVLFLVALLVIHVAPVFHFHEFGEPGRLARDCGFSALLVFGLIFATASAVRSVGGELASGIAAVALARPVSRALFFCAKVFGVCGAFILFLVAVVSATVLAVQSSAVGAHAALCCDDGEVSRIWFPGLAAGTCSTLGAFALAALANRFMGCRFCVGACRLMAVAQPIALLAVAPLAHGGVAEFFRTLPWGVFPLMAVLAAGCCVFIIYAGALSVRLKSAPAIALAASGVLLSFVFPLRALLPEISRFWLVDRLADGGGVPWGEVGDAFCAALCLAALWLLVGALLFKGRELT